MKLLHANSRNPIHPHRDWERLILIFAVLMVVMICWSTYLYLSLTSKEHSSVIEVTEVENGNTKQLETISSFFEKR